MPLPKIKLLSASDTAKPGDYFTLANNSAVFRAIPNDGNGCSRCAFRRSGNTASTPCESAPGCAGITFEHQSETTLAWLAQRAEPHHGRKVLKSAQLNGLGTNRKGFVR